MSRTTNTKRSNHAVNVAAASIAVFLIVMAFLVWRLEVGVDPAIGSPVAQASAQPVIKRKLIVEHKIIKVIRDRPALPPKAASSTYAASGGSSTGSYSAPAQSSPSPSYSAPAQSAPAPAAAPTPAPTTSAS